MPYSTMPAISWKFSGQPYDLNSVLTPDQVWAKLDIGAEEVRTALNALITAQNAITASASTGFTPNVAVDAGANTVQLAYDALVTLLHGTTGAAWIKAVGVAGLVGDNPQALIESLKTYVDSDKVKLTTDQTIAGVKTFSSSPIVPTPTTNTQVANKSYVDSQSPLTIGNGSITDLKLSDAVGDIKDRFAVYQAETMSYEGKKFTINNPYASGGSLSLKGQLHCHTTNSDGVDTPTALVTAYKNAGFDFLTITDHDFITPDPAVSGITWIGSSCEESIYRHINAYDIDTRSTSLNVQDLIEFHRNNGKMTSISHPTWAGVYIIDGDEMKSYYDFNFTEVYNALVSGNGESQLDVVLSFGKKVFAIAVDDCHNVATQINKGWVVVYANENTKSAILNSLRKGNFYASTGNDIAVLLSGNVITASSVASSNITFIGRDGRVLQTNNGVTSATYAIKGDEVYVRVKSVKVSDSKIAWSQPLFIDIVGDNAKVFSDINKIAYSNSMTRQAITNGNLDICQRGITVTNPAVNRVLADRFKIVYACTGTPPANIIHSRQVLTPGELSNSYYYYRVNVDGAGSGYGVGDYNLIWQVIEKGLYLCGSNKKVTVSFYARSSIVGKKLGVYLAQWYGSGGTPTAQEILVGDKIVLTSTWKKYTITLNTNTLVGKTFGTNDDDSMKLNFVFQYGSTFAARVNDTVTETFGGSGNIDIAQVQVCAGDIALPFNLKSKEEEAQKCLRYALIPQGSSILERMVSYTTNTMVFRIPTPAPMRSVPILLGILNTDIIVYSMTGAAQTGFTAYSIILQENCLLLTLTKTTHGLADGYIEIKTTSGFDAEL